MANKLTIYQVQDQETGKIYKVEGPEGATADELGEFILSQQQSAQPAPSEAPAPTPEQPKTETPKAPARPAVVNTVVQGPAPADSRWMGAEEEAKVSSMMADPKYSYGQIDQYVKNVAKKRGLVEVGLSGSEDQLKKYREAIAQGQDPVGIEYTDWKEGLVNPEASVPQKADPNASWDEKLLNAIDRGYQEAVQYGTPGWLARTYHDWIGTGMEQLRQRFPNATPDQLEAMQEELINATQNRLRQQNAIETENDPLVPWLAGQLVGSVGVEDLIPGFGGEGVARRTLGAVGVNAGADLGYQAVDVAQGVQDEYHPEQTVVAGALGGGLHLGLEGISHVASSRRPTVTPEGNVPSEPISVPTARRNSKAFKEQLATTQQHIANHINKTTENWTNSPEFEVHPSFRGIDGLENDAIGATLGDKVLINTDAVIRNAKRAKVSPEDVVNAVTYHEALGHHGLAQQFGDDLETTLLEFYDNGVGSFREKVDKWMNDNPDAYAGQSNRLSLAIEEVLAEMSEKGPLPVTIKDRVSNLIKDFARRMGIDLKFSDREIKTILGMAHNATINGKARDVAGNGYKLMNIGEFGFLSTREKENLRNAKQALETGQYSQDDIYEATGWWKDIDGKWRLRKADNEAMLYGDPNGKAVIYSLPEGHYFNLEEVLDHPVLYEVYPWLRNVSVSNDPNNVGAYYAPSKRYPQGHIGIHLREHQAGYYDIMDTLLHEIQHAIQRYEGFALGGNVNSALKQVPLKAHEVEPAAEKVLTNWEKDLSVVTEVKGVVSALWKRPEVRQAKELFTQLQKIEQEFGMRSPQYAEVSKLYADQSHLVKQQILKNDPELIKIYQEGVLFDNPRYSLEDINRSIDIIQDNIDDLNEALAYGEHDRLRTIVEHEAEVKREAYDWLMGEIEARETGATYDYTPDELKEIGPGVGKIEQRDMSYARITRDKSKSARESDGPSVQEQRRKRQEQEFRSSRGAITPAEAVVKRAETLVKSSPEELIDKTIADLAKYLDEGPLSGMMRGRAAVQFERLNDIRIKQFIDGGKPPARLMRQFTPAEEADILSARKTIEGALDNYKPEFRSWDEGKRAARERGLTAKQIRKAKSIGELDKRLFMYDEAARKTDEKLAALHHKMDTAQFTAADKAKYLETVFSFNEMTARIFEDQAEVARALNAMKALAYTKNKLARLNEVLADFEGNSISAFADENVFQQFADQIKYLMQTDNQVGAHTAMRQVFKPYWWQYLLTFRHAMMLSGLGTHAKNATDNALMVARELEETIMATPGFFVRKGLKRLGAHVEDGASPQEAVARFYGLLRAGLDSMTYKDSWDAFRKGHDNRQINSKIEMADARIPVVSKVQDALHASDTFFRAFHTNANLYALGVRRARDEGFTGLAAFTEGSNYAANPSAKMLKDAKQMTDLALLVDTPSGLSAKLESVKSIRPNMNKGDQALAFFANMMFSFFRVTDRLLFQQLRRSPLFFLDKNTRADLAAGGARRDIAIARTLYGSLLLWLYWQDAGEGKVEGKGPADYKKRQALEAGGYMPNSVKKDGKYVDATALNLSFFPTDPQNAVAANVASIRKAYEEGKADKATTAEALGYAALSLGSVLSSSSFAENISTYIEPFSENQEYERDAAVSNLLGGFGSQWIPAALRQYNQAVADPIKRDTTGDKTIKSRVKGRLMSAIPGLSEQLPAKYDLYGEEMQQGRSLSGLNNYQPIKNDAVSKELQRLERTTDKPVVVGAPSSFEHNGESIKLTADGKQEWQRVQGYYLKAAMSSIIRSEEWKSASDQERVEIVKEVRTDAYEATKDYMLPLLGVQDDEE